MTAPERAPVASSAGDSHLDWLFSTYVQAETRANEADDAKRWTPELADVALKARAAIEIHVGAATVARLAGTATEEVKEAIEALIDAEFEVVNGSVYGRSKEDLDRACAKRATAKAALLALFAATHP